MGHRKRHCLCSLNQTFLLNKYISLPITFLTQALAELVTEDDLAVGRVYPPLQDVRKVSVRLAVHTGEYAYKKNIASLYPQPDDMEAFVKRHMYDYNYDNFEPEFYDWPTQQ